MITISQLGGHQRIILTRLVRAEDQMTTADVEPADHRYSSRVGGDKVAVELRGLDPRAVDSRDRAFRENGVHRVVLHEGADGCRRVGNPVAVCLDVAHDSSWIKRRPTHVIKGTDAHLNELGVAGDCRTRFFEFL